MCFQMANSVRSSASARSPIAGGRVLLMGGPLLSVVVLSLSSARRLGVTMLGVLW